MSDPEAPEVAESMDPGGCASDVAISGGYAYVAARGGDLVVVDLGDYAP